jgi:hypothetical protein
MRGQSLGFIIGAEYFIGHLVDFRQPKSDSIFHSALFLSIQLHVLQGRDRTQQLELSLLVFLSESRAHQQIKTLCDVGLRQTMTEQ